MEKYAVFIGIAVIIIGFMQNTVAVDADDGGKCFKDGRFSEYFFMKFFVDFFFFLLLLCFLLFNSNSKLIFL